MALKHKVIVVNTPTAVKKRSALCNIREVRSGKYKKIGNSLVYEIIYAVRCLDGTRNVTLRYISPEKFGRSFGKGLVLAYPDDNMEVWVSCTCPYHKFYVEVALAKHKSSSIIFSNGKDPKIKNSKLVPFCCKHVLKSLDTAKKDYAKLNKSKKLQQKLNVKNLVDTKKYKLFEK